MRWRTPRRRSICRRNTTPLCGENILCLFGPFYTAAHIADERGRMIASCNSGYGAWTMVPTREEMQFDCCIRQIYMEPYRAAQPKTGGGEGLVRAPAWMCGRDKAAAHGLGLPPKSVPRLFRSDLFAILGQICLLLLIGTGGRVIHLRWTSTAPKCCARIVIPASRQFRPRTPAA